MVLSVAANRCPQSSAPRQEIKGVVRSWRGAESGCGGDQSPEQVLVAAIEGQEFRVSDINAYGPH